MQELVFSSATLPSLVEQRHPDVHQESTVFITKQNFGVTVKGLRVHQRPAISALSAEGDLLFNKISYERKQQLSRQK